MATPEQMLCSFVCRKLEPCPPGHHRAQMDEIHRAGRNEDDPLLLDGFDPPLGHAWVWNGAHREHVAIYSGPDLVAQLAREMPEEEAEEYVEYNIEGAYVGPNTPVVVWP